MGMDYVGAEYPDGLFHFRNLTEIAEDSLPVHTEISALDALLLHGGNLLRDERSIMAMLATGDDQNTHPLNPDVCISCHRRP